MEKEQKPFSEVIQEIELIGYRWCKPDERLISFEADFLFEGEEKRFNDDGEPVLRLAPRSRELIESLGGKLVRTGGHTLVYQF